MPRPRFNKLAQEKRDAILGAAMDEFATHGYHDASYNRIIQQAGVSKGAMYYYFDDKADLYATVFDMVNERLAHAFEIPDDATTPEAFWEELRCVSARMVSFSLENPQVIALVRSALKLREHADIGNLTQLRNMARSWASQMIEHGQRAGAVRNDLPFDFLVDLVSAVDEVGDIWVVEHTDLGYDALLNWSDQFLELLWRLLTPGLTGYSRGG